MAINKKIKKFPLLFGTFLALVISFISAPDTSALYGRSAYRGYFTNGQQIGGWAACGRGTADDGRIFCDGIGVNDIGSFVDFYRWHLWNGDRQTMTGSAFTVLVMLGVDGPNAGGNQVNGINLARSRFSEWEARVRSYDAAGRVNFNEDYQYFTNTGYKAGSVQDVMWYNTNARAISITFDIGGGAKVAIKKSCGNLVGAYGALPSIQNPPGGWLDGASCNAIAGWARDPDYAGSIDVHLYIDGPTGVGTRFATVRANASRPDVGGNYGYRIDMPLQYKDGRAHSIYAYAIGVNSAGTPDGQNPALSGTPKTFGPCAGKRPTVQVRGGDAWSGGSFSSGTPATCPATTATGFIGINTNAGGTDYGSWGEYGLLTTGRINTFGSAARVGSYYSSFSNTAPAALGYWNGNAASQRCMTDFSTMVPSGGTTTPATTIDLDGASVNGVITATASGTINIRANTPISAGKRIVIKTSGTQRLVITGSQLAYAPGPYTSLASIPRVVIIGGGDVVIDDTVTRIDAWVQAKGTLYTCDTPGDASGRLTVTDCSSQLTFNGPVTANRISLRRTAGSDTTTMGMPAEIFNLRPDTYLSSYASATGASSPQTVYQVELPPRY